MEHAAEKMKSWYEIKPGAPLYLREFGFYSLDRWTAEGNLPPRDKVADYDTYLREVFMLDEPAEEILGGLGGCEAPFEPVFETCVLEDRGEYELVRDHAGRHVLYFKGRRSGFMPEYVDHPVKDMKSFEQLCLWRLDPGSPARTVTVQSTCRQGIKARNAGKFLVQYIVGGYMYLRSLIGPTELLFAFYDQPELIHACMRAWLAVTDSYTAAVQKELEYDKLMLDEDICYNHGSLISHDMIRAFLFPYYTELFSNIRRRQKRSAVLELDTDGMHDGIIDLYREIGLSSLAPFEIAAGCDAVRTAARYPDLRICGGMDKRVLASTPDAIDRMLDRVIPPLRARGGYIPTCDHGVPEEVSFNNYIHFRMRLREYAL